MLYMTRWLWTCHFCHLQQRTFAASPFSDPIIVKLHSGMTQQMENPEMLWVMGPVLAVILIIIIVIAILLFKRWVWQIKTADVYMYGRNLLFLESK